MEKLKEETGGNGTCDIGRLLGSHCSLRRKRTEKESPAKRPRSEPTRRSAKIPSAWEQTNVEEVEDGPSLEVEDQLTEWALRRSVR